MRQPPSHAAKPPPPPGGETVLVVEDQEVVRNLVAGILAAAGYEVHAAALPGDALAAAERLDRLDVLVTDLVMPAMSGTDLAQRIRNRHRESVVIFMSGYSSDTVLENGNHMPAALLEKPFTAEELTNAINTALAARTPWPAEASPSAHARLDVKEDW